MKKSHSSCVLKKLCKKNHVASDCTGALNPHFSAGIFPVQQTTYRSLQRENAPSTLLKESSLQQPTAYREKVGLLFMAHFHKKYLLSYSCPAPTAKQQPSSIKKWKEIFAKPTLP